MPGKTTSKFNHIHLLAGNILHDATNGTEIVNYRTMIANSVGSVVVANGGSLGETILEGGATSAIGDVTLRNLVGGTNITLTAFEDTILIEGGSGGDGTITGVQMTGLATGTSLLQGIGTQFDDSASIPLKTLIGGTNITIDETADTLTINAGGAGGGIVTSVNAVGGGISLLQAGLTDPGATVEMVSLIPGNNIVFAVNDETITISALNGGGGGTLTDVASVGGGVSLLQNNALLSNNPVNLRTLVAGTNIELVETDSSIEIISALGASAGTVTSVNTLGNGNSLLADGSPDEGPVVELKSLVPGQNVSFTPSDGSGSTITISSATPAPQPKAVLSTNEANVYANGTNGFLPISKLIASSVTLARATASLGKNALHGTAGARFTMDDANNTTIGVASGNGAGKFSFGPQGRYFKVNETNKNFRIEVTVRAQLRTVIPLSVIHWQYISLIGGVVKNKVFSNPGVNLFNEIVDTLHTVETSTNNNFDGNRRPFFRLYGTFVMDNYLPTGVYAFQPGDLIYPYINILQVFNNTQAGLLQNTDMDRMFLSYRVIEY